MPVAPLHNGGWQVSECASGVSARHSDKGQIPLADDYPCVTAYCLRFVEPLHSATVFTLERLVRFRGLILALMGRRPLAGS
jgi:hypothetical protein